VTPVNFGDTAMYLFVYVTIYQEREYIKDINAKKRWI